MQLLGAFADAGSTQDNPHALGDIQTAHGLARLGTVIAFDLARYATGTGVVGHQHQITTGEADERGQGRALIAALFLFHLNDQLLADIQFVLDAAATIPGAGFQQCAVNFLKGEEAMTLGAKIHKRGFQAGLDADHATFIYVRFLLFASDCFNIKIIQTLAIH